MKVEKRAENIKDKIQRWPAKQDLLCDLFLMTASCNVIVATPLEACPFPDPSLILPDEKKKKL